MTRVFGVMLLASVPALMAPPIAAQASAPNTVLYRLDDDAVFQRGCFAPCMCPVMEQGPVSSKFRLTPTGSDPQFQYYAVTSVDWRVALPGGSVLPVQGAGTFKIGGEVAIQEQLSLDLVVGNDPAQHFDSGLVAPSVPFPLIDLTISINGGYCHDTVIQVRARPFPKIEVASEVISWDPDPPATTFEVVRGDLGTLRSGGGAYQPAVEECVADNVSADTVPFQLSPAPGGGFWFLVRPEGGSYDAWDLTPAAPRDPGIDASPVSCR